MPKCKKCDHTISKFDKEICPYCGEKNPIEDINEYTIDITQAIDTIQDEDDSIEFSIKKRKTLCIYSFLLGFIGADDFYLGFKTKGIIRLLSSCFFFVAIFLAMYFCNVNLMLSCLVPLIIVLIVQNVFFGVLNIFDKTKKDSNGVLIK